MSPDIDITVLHEEWATLLGSYGIAEENAAACFVSIRESYTAPDRHYHTLEHVAEMLSVARRLAAGAHDLRAVELAVWLHDVVYDSKRSDNEEQSARFAGRLLAPLGIGGTTIGRVEALVRLTAHGSATAVPGSDGAVLLDADLSILGAPDERYARYAADIRKEYLWVPEPQYRAGRAQVLSSFLNRTRIFLTDLMRREREERARENLEKELRELDVASLGG